MALALWPVHDSYFTLLCTPLQVRHTIERPQEGRPITALFLLPGEEGGRGPAAAEELQADRRGVPRHTAGVQVR